MSPPRLLAGTLGAGTALGAAVTAYAVWEARAYTLRSVTMAVLPDGASPLRVLHLSDLHLTPGQGRKREWIRSLADLEPDLVINTGDSLAHVDAIPSLLEALGPLLDVPGAFVLGSNDYFAPVLRNPLWYVMPDDGRRSIHATKLPWRDLVDALSGAGWVDLSNRRTTMIVRDLTVAWAGVDDPHLRYDDLEAVAGRADADADLRVAVAHAPYVRVLDQFAADGYDAIFAGHTHGGQIALPLWGALVTNCDLEPARAKGLHRHPARSRPGDEGSAWLHVSAGLGTSPYFPIRTACRPEATLLTLTSVD
jgi:predicted MPP superfamily phosphohydrolase